LFGFIVGKKEEWIPLVKGREWVLKFVLDDSAVHIAQQCFIVLGFVRKPAIIDKNVL
jgi:hypothetical protein